MQAIDMTYSHAKVQGQWSVRSEDRVETNGRSDGQTEVIALPRSLMRSVTSYHHATEYLICVLEKFLATLNGTLGWMQMHIGPNGIGTGTGTGGICIL